MLFGYRGLVRGRQVSGDTGARRVMSAGLNEDFEFTWNHTLFACTPTQHVSLSVAA